MLAARGVCVVLHTFASLGVPHHPPLTLTPLGLALQDFRLASGTSFTLAGSNFRGGDFSPHNNATLSAELQEYEGFSCCAAFQPFKGTITNGTTATPLRRRYGKIY